MEANLIVRLKTTLRGGWYDDTPQEHMIRELERSHQFAKSHLSMREQSQIWDDLVAVRDWRPVEMTEGENR